MGESLWCNAIKARKPEKHFTQAKPIQEKLEGPALRPKLSIAEDSEEEDAEEDEDEDNEAEWSIMTSNSRNKLNILSHMAQWLSNLISTIS